MSVPEDEDGQVVAGSGKDSKSMESSCVEKPLSTGPWISYPFRPSISLISRTHRSA
jgi:hypothetical protein